MTSKEYQNKWFASNIYQRTDFIEMLNQFERDILIERDSIWMDSIAHCDILTNDNIAEIKRAVSWHDKPHQSQNNP